MYNKILIRILAPILLTALCYTSHSQAQSIELMAGEKRVFADAQWLKAVDSNFRWTIFSRSRATVDYDDNSGFFTGAYVNYTLGIGLGGSVVGKINSAGGGVDAGIHIFKSSPEWTLFGLASVGMKSNLELSWFSILRYTPRLGEHWRLYSSLELFTAFTAEGHAFSVQRARLGVGIDGYQFGIANNLSEFGRRPTLDNNFGLFIRKSF